MQKSESKNERIALIVLALLAVGWSVWLILQAGGFAETLVVPKASPKQEFGPIEKETEVAEAAIARLRSPIKPWTMPVKVNKAVPLNKAVLLVKKDAQIYDLFVEQPQFRPPMTNEFVRKLGPAAYLSPNVAELDPDKDGFGNLEEFQKGTDPLDPKSHPPATDRLFLLQRISHDFLITLKSTGSPLQIKITTEDKKSKGWFAEGEGKAFGVGDRFVIKKFEKKVIPDPKLGEKDVSELTVEDRLRKNEFVLVKDVETNLADFEAMFEFRLGRISQFQKKVNETFRLPGFDDITYKLIDIKEDSAVVSPIDAGGKSGQDIIIKKG
jgi:hypothetical protein